MPFALLVEWPGNLQKSSDPVPPLEVLDTLVDTQFCSLETCGWTWDIIVIVTRDETLQAVRALLTNAGYRITHEQSLRAGQPQDGVPKIQLQHRRDIAHSEQGGEEPVLLPFLGSTPADAAQSTYTPQLPMHVAAAV